MRSWTARVRAHRDFEPGEAYADHRRQLQGIAGELAALGLDVARTAQDIVDAHELHDARSARLAVA